MENLRSRYATPNFRFARFTLSGVEFGVEITSVKEIVKRREVARSAGCPAFVDGFISLRGILVPVVDLRKRFGLKPLHSQTIKMIVASVDGRITAFAVDEVSDIEAGSKELMITANADSGEPWAGCVEAVVEVGGVKIRIINPSLILSGSEKGLLDGPLTAG